MASKLSQATFSKKQSDNLPGYDSNFAQSQVQSQPLLNEELKSDEIRKIEKYAQLLGDGENSCFDWCIVETILYHVNQVEFF